MGQNILKAGKWWNNLKTNIISYKYFLLCFLLPLILLVAFATAFYVDYMSRSKNTLIEEYNTKLANIGTALNRSISKIQSTAFLLSSSEGFYKIFYSPRATPILQSEFSSAVKTISYFRTNIDLADGTWVYLRDRDKVLCAEGFIDEDIFFQTNYLEEYPKSFWEDFKAKNLNFSLLKPTLTESRFVGSSTKNTRYVIPLVTSNIQDFKGKNLLVVNISQNKINELLSSYKKTENELLFVADSGGDLIAASDMELAREFLSDFSDKWILSGIFSGLKWKNEKWQLISAKADNFKYDDYFIFSLSPEREYYSDLKSFKLIFLVILLMTAAIVLMLVYLFKRNIIKPIQSLSEIMGSDAELSSGSNIISYLNQKTAELLSKSNLLQNELSMLVPMASQQKMISMLTDSEYLMGDEVKRFLQSHGDHFPNQGFCVGILQPSFSRQFHSMFTEENKKNIIKFLINVIMLEINSDYPCQVLTFQKDQIIAVLNVPEPFVPDYLEEKFERVINLFSYDKELIRFSGGISLVAPSYKGINSAYKEALTALGTVSPLSENPVAIFQKEIKHSYCIYTTSDENRLYYLVTGGHADEAAEFVRELSEQNLSQNISQSEHKKLQRFIYLTIIRAMETKQINCRELMGDLYIDLLSAIDSMEILETDNYIFLLLNKLDEYFKSSRKFDINEITAYIDKHYSEDIYLDVLARRFGVSEKYISKLFKDSLNIGFHDYLSNARVSAAKELLAGTDENVIKIGEMVGFNNYSTFFRTFKSIETISPTQYRSINRR